MGAGEEIDLLAAEALLEFREGNGAAITPADDFAVEDEIARDAAGGIEKLREFGNAIEGAGIDFDLRIALVDLGTDAIEFVFDEGSVGKRGDEVGGRVGGAGEHDGDRAKEFDLDGGKLARDGEPENVGDVAGKHVGALNGGERLTEGFGNGFFDETFFEADAELPGGDLDEVFGFEGRQTLERVFEKSLFGGGNAPLREGGVDFRDLGKTEGWRHGLVAQDFLGASAKIAVMTEEWGEFGRTLVSDGLDGAKEKREADGEDAFLTTRKNATTQIE